MAEMIGAAPIVAFIQRNFSKILRKPNYSRHFHYLNWWQSSDFHAERSDVLSVHALVFAFNPDCHKILNWCARRLG